MCDKLTFMVPELGQSPLPDNFDVEDEMLIFEAYSSSGGRDINLNGFCFVQTGSLKALKAESRSKISRTPKFVWFKAPLQMKAERPASLKMTLHSKF